LTVDEAIDDVLHAEVGVRYARGAGRSSTTRSRAQKPGWAVLRLVALGLAWMLASPALAQEMTRTPSLREALTAYERGDFAAATEHLAAFEHDLAPHDVQDLHAFYELRALLAFAQEDSARLAEVLRALAALNPDHAFSARIPPEVVARFAELRDAHPTEPLVLDVTASSPAPETLRVESEVRGSAAYLVQRVIVSLREEGTAQWQRIEGTSTQRVRGGARVAYYGEALGPGAVVLASSASAEQPLLLDIGTLDLGSGDSNAVSGTTASDTAGSDTADSDTTVWIGLGIAAALVLVGAGIGIGYGVYAAEPRQHLFGAGDVDFVVGMQISF
jgi:hypothetical protein